MAVVQRCSLTLRVHLVRCRGVLKTLDYGNNMYVEYGNVVTLFLNLCTLSGERGGYFV